MPLWLNTTRDYAWSDLGIGFLGGGGVFGILTDASGNLSGPFGSGALLLSLCIPAAIATVFIVGAKARTKEILETRNKYKEVEKEFNADIQQQERKAFELALFLFVNQFEKESLKRYVEELKGLKYDNESKGEGHRLRLLDIFEKMLNLRDSKR